MLTHQSLVVILDGLGISLKLLLLLLRRGVFVSPAQFRAEARYGPLVYDVEMLAQD